MIPAATCEIRIVTRCAAGRYRWVHIRVLPHADSVHRILGCRRIGGTRYLYRDISRASLRAGDDVVYCLEGSVWFGRRIMRWDF